MENLTWIHPTVLAWHYGKLRDNGEIEDGDYGSVIYLEGEKKPYSCMSTKSKGYKYTKSLEDAKKAVEDILK